MGFGEAPLPDMVPGPEEALTIEYKSEHNRRMQIDLMWPTRFSAATVDAAI